MMRRHILAHCPGTFDLAQSMLPTIVRSGDKQTSPGHWRMSVFDPGGHLNTWTCAERLVTLKLRDRE
jgi:hypothetical protein